MPQEFTNPYHFVPIEEPQKKGSKNSEHWLNVNNDFDNRQLKHYSHAQYHPDTRSGRLICRLTTEDAMFVGALREQENKNEPATVTPFELEGQPAIPASTLRGLLSSIAETASNSALRVLHDQVLSYRKAMGEALPAIGMVLIKEEQGQQKYYLKPLALPLLAKLKQGDGYTYCTDNEQERLAYLAMFRGKARLKVYINGYDLNDNPINFLENKTTFTNQNPEFYYAHLCEHKFVKQHGTFVLPAAHDDSLHGTRGGHVDAQKTVNNSPIITEEEWRKKPISEQKLYTRGLLRILGKRYRGMPEGKKYELFIPYPDGTQGVDTWQDFPILLEAIDRFHQLADERTNAGENPPLPYEPLGTQRNKNHDALKEELASKGLKNGDQALRLKHGDLVYFRPTLKDDKAVVAEIAFSSIWRGRVEDDHDESASVYRFFSAIDPELLPFHKGRNFISPAELLFGFTQKDEDEKGKKKAERNMDGGRALAGRIQISFGQLASEQKLPHYHERVLLKNLLSPKLPCPMMYFKNRYTSQEYIYKPDLKPVKHHPQGRKMYVHSHRDNGKLPWKSLDADNSQTKKLKEYVTPVRKDTAFYFHIDFNNLSDWELGMLCYALRPTEAFRHKLGMGKSIGLGRVRIDPIGLFLIDRKQRYRATNIFQAPRYHAAWIDKSMTWPTDWYIREQKAVEQTKMLVPHWENLREAFRESIPANVKNALELLGNPNSVPCVVQTPQLAGRAGAELERENFKWFVENEREHHQMLKPLDEKSSELPTFNRN